MITDHKQQFLTKLRSIPVRNGHLDFISSLGVLIAGAEFKHSYEVEFKAWRKEIGKRRWHCVSLLDAKRQYWWHGGFEANSKILSELSKSLRGALENKCESDILYWSMRILEWGEVYKGSVGYILNRYRDGALGESILAAVAILEGEAYGAEKFDQKQLRMDSGLTKLYSLASDRSVIMDSRVAAALSLVATRVLETKSLPMARKLNAFACGKSVSSEKKRSHIGGVKIFSPYLKPTNQAHYNLVTNWIIGEAILEAAERSDELHEMWKADDDSGLFRAIEASLFMVGSDISGG